MAPTPRTTLYDKLDFEEMNYIRTPEKRHTQKSEQESYHQQHHHQQQEEQQRQRNLKVEPRMKKTYGKPINIPGSSIFLKSTSTKMTIPSIKSTQHPRTFKRKSYGQQYRNHLNRNSGMNEYLSMASEQQGMDQYGADIGWKFENDIESVRKRNRRQNSILDVKTSSSSSTTQGRRQDSIPIDLNISDEDSNHKDDSVTSTNQSISQPQSQSSSLKDEESSVQDISIGKTEIRQYDENYTILSPISKFSGSSSLRNISTTPKISIHDDKASRQLQERLEYQSLEERYDNDDDTLSDTTENPKPSSSFATKEITRRLSNNMKVMSIHKGVDTLEKNVQDNYSTKSKMEKVGAVYCVPKVNNRRRNGIQSTYRDSTFSDTEDEDTYYAMLTRHKMDSNDDDYIPKKTPLRVGDRAIQKRRDASASKTNRERPIISSQTSSNSGTRLTRSSSKNKKGPYEAEEVIILSSDDESLTEVSTPGKENSNDKLFSPQVGQMTRSSPRKHAFGERKNIIASRLAIGSKVFKNAKFSYTSAKSASIILDYERQNGDKNRHQIRCRDISVAHYHVPDEGQPNASSPGKIDNISSEDSDTKFAYLIFRIPASVVNGLDQFSNAYLDDETYRKVEKKEIRTCKENEKRFVVIEFILNNEFRIFFHDFKCSLYALEDELSALLDSGSLSAHQIEEYTTAFCVPKPLSIAVRDRLSSNKRYKEDEIILVFPFEATPEELDSAAQGMKEANQYMYRNDYTLHELGAQIESAQQKTHMVTVRGGDINRLEPMEFFNDSLIDFWMRWITRKESASPESKIHIFTTQFFTALEDNGVEAVTKWTANKNIDIFDKKFVFIPINKHIHWSLCVVVNPGQILNGEKIVNKDDFNENGNTTVEAPLLLFMDSLRVHNKIRVQKHIYDWLNSEAARLGKFKDSELKKTKLGLFNRSTMPLFDPPVPRQDNTWDCGVFVCRYAYAIFQLYLENIAFDVDMCIDTSAYKERIHQLILSHPAFQFGMIDIARIRIELKELLENLSQLYSSKRKVAKKKSKKADIYASKADSTEEQKI